MAITTPKVFIGRRSDIFISSRSIIRSHAVADQAFMDELSRGECIARFSEICVLPDDYELCD
jgi:hypothetical protein